MRKELHNLRVSGARVLGLFLSDLGQPEAVNRLTFGIFDGFPGRHSKVPQFGPRCCPIDRSAELIQRRYKFFKEGFQGLENGPECLSRVDLLKNSTSTRESWRHFRTQLSQHLLLGWSLKQRIDAKTYGEPEEISTGNVQYCTDK